MSQVNQLQSEPCTVAPVALGNRNPNLTIGVGVRNVKLGMDVRKESRKSNWY